MSWASGTTVNTSTIWNYAFTKPASYIIRVNGSYYEAINGTTGKVSFGGSGDAGGATGTNAASVIQASGDALTTGGSIFLKPATWSLSTAITFTTGPLVVVGAGDSTIIQNDGSITTGSLISFTGNYSVLIANMKIDNNSVGTATHGVSFAAGSGTAENLYVTNTSGTGILGIVDTTNFDVFSVKNCRVSGAGTSGTGPAIRADHEVGSTQTIDTVVLERNWLVSNGEHGVKIYDSTAKNSTVKNNYIYNTASEGISTLADLTLIKGNYVDTASGKGVSTSGAKTKIIGNYIANTTQHGVSIESTATSTIVSKNHLYTTGSTASYMGVACNAINLSAKDNYLDTCAGSGIKVNANGAVIARNKITGSTTRDIYLNNASNCIVSENIIDCANGVGEYGTADTNLIINNRWTGATNFIYTGPSLNTIIRGNIGYNPKGKITNPFKDSTNSISIGQGDAATPTASTDYTIKNGDIVISSGASGNNNNAIQIDDPNGNAIFPSTQLTLTMMTVPRGYIINWGAYTGAAPTVVVCYE